MSKLLVTTLLLVGLAVCASATIDLCVMPLVDTYLGNTTARAGTTICKAEYVNFILSIGTDPNSPYLPGLPEIPKGKVIAHQDQNQDDHEQASGKPSRYVITGYYGSDLKTSITSLTIAFMPNGDDTPVTISSIIPSTKTSNGLHCFDADTVVSTSAGPKQITDLVTGDMIQTGPNTYAEMIGWLHRDPNQIADFYEVSTDNITVSAVAQHFIFMSRKCIGEPEAEFISHIRVGDCLLVLDDTGTIRKEPVLDVDVVSKTGVFSPYVNSDSLFVSHNCSYDPTNPVFAQASPYAYLYPTELQKQLVDMGMRLSSRLQNLNQVVGINPVIDIMTQLGELVNWFNLQRP